MTQNRHLNLHAFLSEHYDIALISDRAYGLLSRDEKGRWRTRAVPYDRSAIGIILTLQKGDPRLLPRELGLGNWVKRFSPQKEAGREPKRRLDPTPHAR